MSEQAIPSFASPSDKKILIVDDDKSILELIDHTLKQHGFRTERAGDGAEAVKKAQAAPPQLILMDLMLPGLSGFEVIHHLQLGETSGIPLLVITGRRMDSKSVELLKREPNVREYMEKPIRLAILTSTVHRILNTKPPENIQQDTGPLRPRRGW